jgi:hypothetical protein
MVVRKLLVGGALFGAAGVGAVEARYRRHPGNDLRVEDEDWAAARTAPDRFSMSGRLVLPNPIARREVMVCDVDPVVHLLGDGPVDDLRVTTKVRSLRKDYPAREDGYWVAYVVKPARYGEASPLEIEVDVAGPPARLDGLYAAWLEVRLGTYGFEGRRDQFHHVVVPLRFPDADDTRPWQDAAGGRAQVRAVRTHLLGPLDDPVDVVARYALPHARPGDIVTLGESPLAVVQGRFRDPRMLPRTWAGTRLAQFMHGEGALGTAGGMQALIDEQGAWRVFAGLAGGALGKAAGKAGWFYRLAGPQARLVDDVTGTLPPYDNFVVVGPERADEVCAAVTAATGLAAAVVDANDLGNVDVLGATPGVERDLVCAALTANPAGNADETTPIVLVRPVAPGRPSPAAPVRGRTVAAHGNGAASTTSR